MYGTIQAKAHYGYSSVNIESAEREKEMERKWEKNQVLIIKKQKKQPSSLRSPDPVAGTTVPPSTLNLLESINAALLPPEAAARPVDVVDPRFGVYCKV